MVEQVVEGSYFNSHLEARGARLTDEFDLGSGLDVVEADGDAGRVAVNHGESMTDRFPSESRDRV